MANDDSVFSRTLMRLGLKKPPAALSREQAMEAWPLRNPSLKWRENPNNGMVVVELPRRKDWMGGVMGWLFFVPEAKPIELDEVGSFVWMHCDGEHSINDLVRELCAEYKLNKREVEISLTQYLQTLGKRGMIAFAVPRDVADTAGLKGMEVIVAKDEDQNQENAAEADTKNPAPQQKPGKPKSGELSD